MLTLKPVVTVALAVSLGAVAPPSVEAPPVLDGHGPPPRVEGAYAFHCPDIRAAVRYRQERFDPESVPRTRIEDSLRVTLLELTVAGASLPADQFASAGEVFRSFAWVRDLSATCYRGSITISVRGMPLRLFGETLRGRAPLPALRISSIRLSASGVVGISEFDPLDAPAHRD
jgi:hypothetical protein